jgi:hypothetical protein
MGMHLDEMCYLKSLHKGLHTGVCFRYIPRNAEQTGKRSLTSVTGNKETASYKEKDQLFHSQHASVQAGHLQEIRVECKNVGAIHIKQ